MQAIATQLPRANLCKTCKRRGIPNAVLALVITTILVMVAGCSGTWDAGPGPVEEPDPVEEGDTDSDNGPPFEVYVHWDPCPLDAVIDQTDVEGEYIRMMERLAEAGVSRVYYKATVVGAVSYYSQLIHVWDSATTQQIDPLEVVVREAHRHGIEVHASIEPFFCVGTMWVGEARAPNETDSFFIDHPEYNWQYIGDEYQREWYLNYWFGYPCYGYEAVREHRLNQIREILDYGVDGLLICMRNSTVFTNRNFRAYWGKVVGYGDPVPIPLVLGFNPPVVEEYVERYGIAPRETEMYSPERAKFVELTGEIWTRFMREVRSTVGDLPVGMVAPFPWIQDPLDAISNYMDGETILNEGLVDEPWHYGPWQHDFDSLVGHNVWECWWDRVYSYVGGNDAEGIAACMEAGMDQTVMRGHEAICFHELTVIDHWDTYDVIAEYLSRYEADDQTSAP